MVKNKKQTRNKTTMVPYRTLNTFSPGRRSLLNIKRTIPTGTDSDPEILKKLGSGSRFQGSEYEIIFLHLLDLSYTVKKLIFRKNIKER